LLAAGYLPKELPPVFVSSSFADHAQSLLRKWPASDLAAWKSVPEVFSIPKSGHARRGLAIVNPVSQLKVAKLIADDWVSIRSHIRSSGLTEFTPVIDMRGDRAILPVNYSEINRRRARLRARYTRILASDISRFYPSIYTHSITWALHGKEWTKKNLNNKALIQATLGDKLDRAVRQGQDNQTIGIPVGPETSRILAEIIAVGIDKELFRDRESAAAQGLRYVDDYSIGIPEGHSDDSAVANLVGALAKYGLEFQAEKTSVEITGYDERPSWVRIIQKFPFDRSQPENSLRDYFDELISQYSALKRDEILTYGVKRSRAFVLYYGSVVYYIDRLLHIGRLCADALPAVVQAILDRNQRHANLRLDELRKFVIDMIERHAPLRRSFEVVWALFLARGLGLSFKRSELAPVFDMESSIAALVAMDMDARGQIASGADQKLWKSYANADGLSSEMWLLAYEAAKKGWWKGVSDAYVKGNPLFGPMLARDVFFYDETRNVSKTLAELARQQLERRRIAMMFRNLPNYL